MGHLCWLLVTANPTSCWKRAFVQGLGQLGPTFSLPALAPLVPLSPCLIVATIVAISLSPCLIVATQLPLPPVSLSSRPFSQQAPSFRWLSCDHMPIPGPITVTREMPFSDWPGLSHMSTSGTRVGMNTTQTQCVGMTQGGQRTIIKREWSTWADGVHMPRNIQYSTTNRERPEPAGRTAPLRLTLSVIGWSCVYRLLVRPAQCSQVELTIANLGVTVTFLRGI